MVQWTIDVETDWGGRSAGTIGITEGLPKILQLFKRNNIKGLFFISTELIRDHKHDLFHIKEAGHEIGSHGHFHKRYKRPDQALQDAELSMLILHKTFGEADYPFRAPKFSYRTDDVFSDPKNHVSLLKHMWLGQKIKSDTIFYLHPFDIVKAKNPPNLFCAAWYSRPEKAYEVLGLMCDRHYWSNQYDAYNGTIPQAPKSSHNSHD